MLKIFQERMGFEELVCILLALSPSTVGVSP